MKKTILALVSTIALFVFSGCTSKISKVNALDTEVHHIDNMCIEKNKKVIVSEFLPFVIKELKKHNINSTVYNEVVPNSCLYNLKYSANHHWDIVMYFKAASLEIYKKNSIIASALYETQNGLDMSKFHSMETKFTPIMDELLKGHTAPTEKELSARKVNIELDHVTLETTLEDKLSKIKKMNDNGLITDNEYTIKKQQLLEAY